ncbi:hypothetical protein BLOT_014842 [Blomia tropicalis]|nr:hypothetical protein BLOT_014842 [Blomia tropicalis]
MAPFQSLFISFTPTLLFSILIGQMAWLVPKSEPELVRHSSIIQARVFLSMCAYICLLNSPACSPCAPWYTNGSLRHLVSLQCAYRIVI